jgi:hypothetical protein
MPMREDCKHFQSRTYASGEIARFCVLDLAPEAPWRCPDNCPSYERRLADVTWDHGSLVAPPPEDEPDEPPEQVSELLEEAESVVSSVASEELAEVEAEEARAQRAAASPLGRVMRRISRRGGPDNQGRGGSR